MLSAPLLHTALVAHLNSEQYRLTPVAELNLCYKYLQILIVFIDLACQVHAAPAQVDSTNGCYITDLKKI